MASARIVLQQAVQRLNAGQLQQAHDLISRVIKAAPQIPDAHYLMGVVYRKSGRTSDAIASYRIALTLNDKQPVVLNALGAALLADNQYYPAHESLERAIQLDANNHEAWLNLGLTYLRLDQPDSAARAFGRTLQLKPGLLEAEMGLARAQLAGGSVTDAIDRLSALSNTHSTNARLWFYLGRARFEAGEIDASVESLDRAVSLAPDNGQILHEAARVLAIAGQTETAISYLERSVASAPLDLSRIKDLSRLLYVAGREDALSPFVTALRQSPDNEGIIVEYAMACKHAGRAAEGRETSTGCDQSGPEIN